MNPKKIFETRIIAIGEEEGSSVEIYDSKTGAWAPLPDLYGKRIGAAACIVGSKVIVAGGSRGDSSLSSAEYLDLEADERERAWVMIPSKMKKARGYCSGVLLDDGITFLVTGGCDGDSFSSCEQLNTTTMTWSDAPSMITRRSDHCTVLYKSKVVVLGGYPDTSRCEEFNSRKKKWSSFPRLSQTRCTHGTAVLNDRIFVCGGNEPVSEGNEEMFPDDSISIVLRCLMETDGVYFTHH